MAQGQLQASKLETLAARLQELLTDEFSTQVLSGSMMALWVTANPLRLSHFSAGLRELYGHTLHTVAPDDEVKSCEWFSAETQDGRPSRRQRIRFGIQGGLSDEAVAALGVESNEIHGEMLAVIDQLSKFTHVRPNTIEVAPEEAEAFACDAVATFVAFFETLEECRRGVRRAVEYAVNDHALEVFTQEMFSEIDILSTRSAVDGVQIGSLEITSIGPALVNYRVTGDVYVELSYGSKSDFQRDMGAEIRTDFPFLLTMSAPVGALKAFQDPNPSIDTSSWYDDGDSEDDNFAKITDY
ncbi:hypothetical protein [Mesorhizobium huakuii]|uniref:Uncharacterized protein n=1 Tax=Mesorhizobium huakuii TaxID=28104 RepID=A0A7G6T4K8_9HYPH|nr:hypothetical protein [Mesorhizobium huakuii]QND61690.1 hypothetical protein HB778_36170 [Mesorhizobium huakuii]